MVSTPSLLYFSIACKCVCTDYFVCWLCENEFVICAPLVMVSHLRISVLNVKGISQSVQVSMYNSCNLLVSAIGPKQMVVAAWRLLRCLAESGATRER